MESEIQNILERHIEKKQKNANLSSTYSLSKKAKSKDVRAIAEEIYRLASHHYMIKKDIPSNKKLQIPFIQALIDILRKGKKSSHYSNYVKESTYKQPEKSEEDRINNFIEENFDGPLIKYYNSYITYSYSLNPESSYKRGQIDPEFIINVIKFYLNNYAIKDPDDQLTLTYLDTELNEIRFRSIRKEDSESYLNSDDLFNFNPFSDSAYGKNSFPVVGSFKIGHKLIQGKGLEIVDLDELQKYNKNHDRKNFCLRVIDDIASSLCPAKTENCFIYILSKIVNFGKRTVKQIKNQIKKDMDLDLGDSVEYKDAIKILDHYGASAIITTRLSYTYKLVSQPDKLESCKDLYKFRVKSKLELDTLAKTSKSSDKPYIVILRNGHYYLLKKTRGSKTCSVTGIPVSSNSKSDKADTKTMAKFLKDQDIIDQSTYLNLMQEKLKMPIIKENNKNIRLFTFDYETVYDQHAHIKPYSLCYAQFAVVDKDGNLTKVDDEPKFDSTRKMTINMFNYIEEKTQKDEKAIMVGFNNNNFDNYLICDELNKLECLNDSGILFSGTSILQFVTGRIKSMDLCKIVCSSLKNACDSFKIEKSKTELDHEEFQDRFEELLRSNNWDENKAIEIMRKEASTNQELIDYNKRDIEATAELFIKVREQMKNLTNLHLEKYQTIGQIALDYHKKTTPDTCKQGKIQTEEDYEFIRNSFIGGRAQCFTPGEFELTDDFFESCDVKSLYPYIMKNMPFPIGEYNYTENYVEGKIGIYNVYDIDQSHLVTKIIPEKNEEGQLDWDKDYIKERVLNSVDIETLRKHNCGLKIGNGIYWEDSTSEVFYHFVINMEQEKNRQDQLKKQGSQEYNPCLRNIAKLFLNNLSGKVGQRCFKDGAAIINTKQECEKFMSTHEKVLFEESDNLLIAFGEKKKYFNKNTCKPCYDASLIYSYSRTHMYESILKWSKQKAQMDTDSCFLPNKELERIISEDREKPDYWFSKEVENYGLFKLGSRFGDFERENDHKPNKGFFIAPKNYCMLNTETNKSKTGSKGVPLGKSAYIDESEIEDFKNLDTISQRQKYKSFAKIATEFYEKLIRNKEMTVVCPQIYKNKSKLQLEQIFRVKKITYTQD